MIGVSGPRIAPTRRGLIASIFGDNSNGVGWDFSEAVPALFTDAAGATPLTTPAQTVGTVWDGSRVRDPRTGYAGTQANSGFRPTWGRAPASRRNAIRGSGDVGNTAYWLASATANGITGTKLAFGTGSDGLPYADYRFTGVGAGTTVDAVYETFHSRTAALLGETWTGSYLCTQIAGSMSGVAGMCARVVEENSSDVFLANTLSTAAPCATETLLTATRTLNQATVAKVRTGCLLSFTNGATIDVTFRIKALQLEKAAARTGFQLSLSSFDLTESGFASYGYIRPDRSDDVLSTVLTLAQTGDVAIFGRTASKLEAGLIYGAGATFSLGPTTVTGMSAGVLASVGDVIGLVAIGRTLTAAERALLLAYFQARGAGAYI